MKKKLYFVFFCLIQIFGPVTILSAQSRWGRTIEGANNTPLVRQTTDNGFIVGTTSGTFGLQNAWLVKLNSTGAIQWQKAYGNGGTCSTAHALQQTTDNGFVFAGHLDTACPSEANFWVVKLDSTGAIQWQKSYGGTSTEVAYAITQTSDQGYLVGGSTSSFGAFPGDYHIWLLKLDSNGNIQWQKAIGGNEDEEAKSVQQTSDGGYIVTGFTVSFGAGDEDFFVLKLDSSGNVVWMKTYGGNSTDEPVQIVETTDGGYVVTGFNNLLFWVLKLNGSGNVQWQRGYGFGDPGSIQQTSDGGYIVVGRNREVINSDGWMLKLDPNGNVLWQRRYGGAQGEVLTSVQETTEGDFIVGGITGSMGSGFTDIWLLKTNCGGAIDPSCNCSQNTSNVPSNTSVSISSPNPNVSNTAVVAVTTVQSSANTSASSSQHCSSPTCIFCDYFQDGMLATNWSYFPDINQWNEVGGDLASPNRRRSNAIANPAFAGCNSNCIVQAVLRNTGGQGNMSFFAWYVDRDNNVEFLMREGTSRILLRQRVNGNVVARGRATLPVLANIDYNVRIAFNGTDFTVYIDDVLMITMTAAAAPQPGPIGVQVRRTSGNFCEAGVLQ